MKTKTSFQSLYSHPGFRALARFKSGVKGDQRARVVQLRRHQKKPFVPSVESRFAISTTGASIGSEIWTPGIRAYIWTSNTAASPVRSAA